MGQATRVALKGAAANKVGAGGNRHHAQSGHHRMRGITGAPEAGVDQRQTGAGQWRHGEEKDARSSLDFRRVGTSAIRSFTILFGSQMRPCSQHQSQNLNAQTRQQEHTARTAPQAMLSRPKPISSPTIIKETRQFSFNQPAQEAALLDKVCARNILPHELLTTSF